MLMSAGAALTVTLYETAGYRTPRLGVGPDDQTRLYPWFNLLAAAAIVVVLVSMLWICLYEPASSYVGLFFSYRCLHPTSGVSPLVPMLLLLFAWYSGPCSRPPGCASLR
jgi:hypothetical protein